jgi:macrodomain Ter protein organizer (MatP/YcbG family)
MPGCRLQVIVAPSVWERLQERARTEGRSASNLAAFLLEDALRSHPTTTARGAA